MWLQLLWWKIVRCFKSGLHCTRPYVAFKALKALGGFWSFLKLYMYIQIETFRYAITSHKKQRVKYQTEMLLWIVKRQFRYKQCFQRKNTLTVDTDDQKFNCDNADGHSQTGNRKKKLASWIWKTSRKNKSNEKRLETLFTHRRLNIIFTQTSFYCGFDRFKVLDCELTTSAISMMQNAFQTFLLTFRWKVSSEPCESMQIFWRFVNCYCILKFAL